MPQIGQLQLGAGELGAPPGGGVTNLSLSGTNEAFSTSATSSVNFPTAAQAGDFAVLFAAGGNVPSTPSGWTAAAGPTSTFNWNSGVWFKTLTSSDITTGHVSVSWGGAFDNYLAIATVSPGSQTVNVLTPVLQNNTGTNSSVTLTWAYGRAHAGDLALYFGSNRATSTDTVDRGVSQQAGTNSGNASGCLYAETLGSDTSSLSAVFSYATPGTQGNAQAIVLVTSYGADANVSQAGATALVPSPSPNAQVTQTGLTAIVPSVSSQAAVSQIGLTVIVPSALTSQTQPFFQIIT